MQATTRAAARQRGGLIRRFRRRDDLVDIDDPSPSWSSPNADVIDLRPVGQPDLQAERVRIERLETGVRLIADTMKRAYSDLTASIDTLTRQLDAIDTSATVERVVAEEVAPLAASVRELADTVRGFPHTLAAAMDDMGLAIDTGRWKLERTLAEGLEGIRDAVVQAAPGGTDTGPARQDAQPVLTPTPFELEPVALQFGGASRTE
jgi:hypothetical protein